MKTWTTTIVLLLLSVLPCLATDGTPDPSSPALNHLSVNGEVVMRDGTPVQNAMIVVGPLKTISDSAGHFHLSLAAGDYKIEASAQGLAPVTLDLTLEADTELKVEMGATSAVTVTATADASVDPSTRVLTSDELIPANPGLPGVPVSVPGYPAETASGGVKAPQYFAPGVAGDHGEPIAQYIQVGDFQFQNNLPANAHGNGYADPNLMIPMTIGNVVTDAGAFDVRHGNNAVNLAVNYGLRPRLDPVLEFSGDQHDYDIVSGWSPANPQTGAWVGVEISGGNGFLALPENRKQFKVNGERSFSLGRHQLTAYGVGYYGYSRIPGLVPIDVPVPGDTIDPRQSDRTHTFVGVVSDTWQLSEKRQFQFSGFFRTYSLDLQSDFGDGLIRQSEFRTVVGGNTSFYQQIDRKISFSTGVDLRQDSPRNAELAHLNAESIFEPVTLNNFTIGEIAPYVSLNGSPWRFLDYSLGVRREQIFFDNTDKLAPANSYHANSGLTAPRGTVTLRAPDRLYLPALSFSYGEGFHTNDPRIGLGTTEGTPLATAHALQLTATENIANTQFRLTLSRVSNSQELAKIDPDTGLQEDVGPSVTRALMFSAHRHFSFGSLQATFARATAIETLTHQDVPEAPRLIWDVSGSDLHLPWRLRGALELEYVGTKPLGDGFVAVPVREIRGSVTRTFANGRYETGMHFLASSGYSGQTLETLQLPDEPAPFERIVGVRKPSYVGLSFAYRFRREPQ